MSDIHGAALNGEVLWDDSNKWLPTSISGNATSYFKINQVFFHDNNDGTITLMGGLLTQRYVNQFNSMMCSFPEGYIITGIANAPDSTQRLLCSDPNTTVTFKNTFNLDKNGLSVISFHWDYPSTTDPDSLLYVAPVWQSSNIQSTDDMRIKLNYKYTGE